MAPHVTCITGVKRERQGGGSGAESYANGRGLFDRGLTPSPLAPVKYYNSIQIFHSENIARLLSDWLIYGKCRWGFSGPKANRKYICFITSLMPTIVWCLLGACLTWRLTTNKHGGPAVGTLLPAIYIPFITFVCLLTRLISYHWWQYSLLILNLNEMQEKTYLKVVLLGKVNSGKTCLVTRYITRSFSEETPSVSRSFNSTIFVYFLKKLLFAVHWRLKNE